MDKIQNYTKYIKYTKYTKYIKYRNIYKSQKLQNNNYGELIQNTKYNFRLFAETVRKHRTRSKHSKAVWHWWPML